MSKPKYLQPYSVPPITMICILFGFLDSPMSEIDENKESSKESSIESGQEEGTTTDHPPSTTNTPIDKIDPKSETFTGFAMPTSTVKPAKVSTLSKPSHGKDGARNQTGNIGDVKLTKKSTSEREETFKQPCSKDVMKKNDPKSQVSIILPRKNHY